MFRDGAKRTKRVEQAGADEAVGVVSPPGLSATSVCAGVRVRWHGRHFCVRREFGGDSSRVNLD